jgi:alkanesulfonate monooxygenase SsuD/methylene tetrahydromethanopterin reductase-like flavin-dependent oxidoreductase (luciferase family)
MINNMWLVGDPDSVASQLRELYERVGGFGTLLRVTHDWDDGERWRRSMRLMPHEVLPGLADLC